MKYFVAVLALAVSAFAQTPAPQTFSLTLSPVSLPGGKTTVAGANTGISFAINNSFAFRQDDIIAPSNLQFYGGGFDYAVPKFSTWLNNISPNLNGLAFQLYLTGTAGVDQIPLTGKSHYAFLAGGGLNYKLTSAGTWTLGGEVRYGKLPGWANNTALVSFGPAVHF